MLERSGRAQICLRLCRLLSSCMWSLEASGSLMCIHPSSLLQIRHGMHWSNASNRSSTSTTTPRAPTETSSAHWEGPPTRAATDILMTTGGPGERRTGTFGMVQSSHFPHAKRRTGKFELTSIIGNSFEDLVRSGTRRLKNLYRSLRIKDPPSSEKKMMAVESKALKALGADSDEAWSSPSKLSFAIFFFCVLCINSCFLACMARYLWIFPETHFEQVFEEEAKLPRTSSSRPFTPFSSFTRTMVSSDSHDPTGGRGTSH